MHDTFLLSEGQPARIEPFFHSAPGRDAPLEYGPCTPWILPITPGFSVWSVSAVLYKHSCFAAVLIAAIVTYRI